MNTHHGKFGSSLVFEPVKFTNKIKQTKQEVKAIEKQQKLETSCTQTELHFTGSYTNENQQIFVNSTNSTSPYAKYSSCRMDNNLP